MLSNKEKLWKYLIEKINPIYENYTNEIEILLYFNTNYFEIIYKNEPYQLSVEEKQGSTYLVLKSQRKEKLYIPYHKENSFLDIINFIKK